MIGGLIVATQTRITGGIYASEETHPFVAAGVGVVAVALLQMLVLMCVVRAIGLYASSRTGTDRDAGRAVFLAGSESSHVTRDDR